MATEPLSHTAGDTLAWRRDDLTDYPAAAGWVLSYRLIGVDQNIGIAATGDAQGHAISQSAAATSSWKPGRYQWVASVAHADGRRFTVGRGAITIEPNLAGSTAPRDLRGDARKALDAVNAALASYGAKAYLQEIQLGERRQRFASPSAFMAFRARLQREVAREEAAAGLRPRPSTSLLVRLRR